MTRKNQTESTETDKNLTPQTPGEAPRSNEAETDVTESALVEQGETATDEKVVVSKADLSALMSRLAALESRPAAVVANRVQEVELPDQESIKPEDIKQPVLTKQGWVLPVNFGANPASKNL